MNEIIDEFPKLRQTTTNGCWIACAVMLWNYFNPQRTVSIADTKEEFGLQQDDQGSAVELFGKMYGWNDQEYIDHIPCDQYAIPTFEGIQEEIDQKKPLLCCVSVEKPHDNVSTKDIYRRYEAQTNAENAHWVIIIGSKERRLIIVDPSDGKEHNVPYDKNYYIKDPVSKFFWQSSSYIDI